MLLSELNHLLTEHVITYIAFQESAPNGKENEFKIEIVEREVICKIFLITSFIFQYYFDKLHIKSYQLELVINQIKPFRQQL